MKLIWPDFNNSGSIVIPLRMNDFFLAKKPLEISGDIFTPKQELHITLIGKQPGLSILEKIQHKPEINKLIKQDFEAINWSFEKTGPVHILMSDKPDADSGVYIKQKSIVLELEMRGMADFYNQLFVHDIIDIDTPLPPPHITLYTKNCPNGIGVVSHKRLDEMTVKTLSVNALNELCGE